MAFNTAAPVNRDEGYNDKSGSILPIKRAEYPSIMNLHFFMSDRGRLEKTTLNGSIMDMIYGAESTDPDSKFFTHQTMAINISKRNTNFEGVRIVPSNAKPAANARIWLEVETKNIPNYKRDADGNIEIDGTTGDKVIDPDVAEVPGATVRFVKEVYPDGMTDFKNAVKTVNGQVTRYPFEDIIGASQGDYYNRVGIVLNGVQPKNVKDKFTTDLVTPYTIGLVVKKENSTQTDIYKSNYLEDEMVFSLKEGYKDSATRQNLYAGKVFPKNWADKTVNRFALVDSYFYGEAINEALEQLATLEAGGLTDANLSWYNFSNKEEAVVKSERHLINLITLKSTKNISYGRIISVDDITGLTANQSIVQFGDSTPIYLEGGTNGDLTKANFEAGVRDYLAKYGDANSEVINMSVNPESLILDTGFEPATKDMFSNFHKNRPDTIVISSPYVYDSKNVTPMSLAEERAAGIAIAGKLTLVAESLKFGTPHSRSAIFMGAGFDPEEVYAGLIPVTLSLHEKIVQCFGAGNQQWDLTKLFDAGENTEITNLTDISPKYVPGTLKDTLWVSGLNWPEPTGKFTHKHASLQTLNPNDTSALNHLFTIFAGTAMSKWSHEVWLEVEGSIKLNRDEFAKLVVEKMYTKTGDKFAGVTEKVEYEVEFDAFDDLSNYSWHLIRKITMNGAMTAQESSTEVYHTKLK